MEPGTDLGTYTDAQSENVTTERQNSQQEDYVNKKQEDPALHYSTLGGRNKAKLPLHVHPVIQTHEASQNPQCILMPGVNCAT